MTGPIRALLFDVEGVIARPDRVMADRRLATLAPELDSQALHQARNRPETYPLWERYSVGRMSRYAYWQSVVEALGLPAEPATVVEMLDIQSATCWRRIDTELLALAGRLGAAGLRLGLLSNSAPDHEPFIARFEAQFDVRHFSHRTGYRKPQAEAYLQAVAALQATPETTLFVDDKPRNTEAAAALGLRVWHYRDRAGFEAELVALGLLPGEPRHG